MGQGAVMSYIYGLFDKEEDVKQAVNDLERLGRSNEIVEVITQSGTTSERRTDGPLINTPLVPVAGVIPAATTIPEGMATQSRHWEGLGDVGNYFSSVLERGGQIIVVDTSDAEMVGHIFREANAQRVYDKRAGRDV
jgi:hypothetical protein